MVFQVVGELWLLFMLLIALGVGAAALDKLFGWD
jgi:hypothetical protein